MIPFTLLRIVDFRWKMGGLDIKGLRPERNVHYGYINDIAICTLLDHETVY